MASTPRTIAMSDGSSLQFTERQKVLKKSFVRDDGVLVVKFAFDNGEIKQFEMPASHALFAKAALHGLNQKFGDAFAGIDDTDDCALAFDKVAEMLTNGDWAESRTGGEGVSGTSVLARALMAVTGKSKDEIKAFLAERSHAEKTALRNAEPIASKVREIEAERKPKAKKSADVSGLLGQIGVAPL